MFDDLSLMFDTAINGIKELFSPVFGDGEFCLNCFIHGMGEAVVWGAIGIVALSAIAALSVPVAIAAVVALAIYGVVEGLNMLADADQLSDEEKSKIIGGTAGGIMLGKAAAKGKSPRAKNPPVEKPPKEDLSQGGEFLDDGGYGKLGAGTPKKGPIPDEKPANFKEQILLEQAKAGDADGTNQAIQGGPEEPLGDAARLVDNYGGERGDWVKMKGPQSVNDGGTNKEVHYFKNTKTGQSVEFKFKKQLPKREAPYKSPTGQKPGE